MITEGMKAPEFLLNDDAGKEISLRQFSGKKIVLYFYPKDDTPGCTKEAGNFRDDYSAYQEAGVTILGVSPDSPKSHAKFKLKYHLPFTLLADTDRKVCELYAVWGRKKFLGREYDGVLRTTYVIGTDGKILRVIENVRPAEHSAEVLQVFG